MSEMRWGKVSGHWADGLTDISRAAEKPNESIAFSTFSRRFTQIQQFDTFLLGI